MPTTAMLVGIVLFCLLIYQGLVVIPLHFLQILYIPMWIKWALILGIVAWFIGDS